MTLDELEARLNGQCRNTGRYLSDIRHGHERGQEQQNSIQVGN